MYAKHKRLCSSVVGTLLCTWWPTFFVYFHFPRMTCSAQRVTFGLLATHWGWFLLVFEEKERRFHRSIASLIVYQSFK